MKAGLIDISQDGYLSFVSLRPATSSEVYAFWLAEQLKPLGIEMTDPSSLSVAKFLSSEELSELNRRAGLTT